VGDGYEPKKTIAKKSFTTKKKGRKERMKE